MPRGFKEDGSYAGKVIEKGQHSPLFNRNIRYNMLHDVAINNYKENDYDCLIIWDSELQNPEKVIEKIERFANNGHSR